MPEAEPLTYAAAGSGNGSEYSFNPDNGKETHQALMPIFIRYLWCLCGAIRLISSSLIIIMMNFLINDMTTYKTQYAVINIF